jgi:hypothetical protein
MTPTCYWTSEFSWLGSWNDIVFQVWRSGATVADIEAASSLLTRVAERAGSQVVSVAFLSSEGLPKLGDAERKRAADLAKQTSHHIKIAAQIIEGSGFIASMLRSVVSGVNMLSKNPTKVFASNVEAARFLVDGQHVRYTDGELLSLMERVLALSSAGARPSSTRPTP